MMNFGYNTFEISEGSIHNLNSLIWQDVFELVIDIFIGLIEDHVKNEIHLIRANRIVGSSNFFEVRHVQYSWYDGNVREEILVIIIIAFYENISRVHLVIIVVILVLIKTLGLQYWYEDFFVNPTNFLGALD